MMRLRWLAVGSVFLGLAGCSADGGFGGAPAGRFSAEMWPQELDMDRLAGSGREQETTLVEADGGRMGFFEAAR